MTRLVDALARLAVFLSIVSPAWAQTSSLPTPTYGLPVHVVAGGGGTSSGGTYTIVGTIGQIAAEGMSASGPYVMTEGFEATTDARTYLPFTDEPLIAGVSRMQAVHVAELRSRVDALRTRFGCVPPSYPYFEPTLTGGLTLVRAQHLLDLRTALSEAYVAAGRAAPTFGVPIGSGLQTTAAAITELRTAVIGLE